VTLTVKLLPSRYHFQLYMTMTGNSEHYEEQISAFAGVVNSMQLLSSKRAYEEQDFRILVTPSEYRAQRYGE